MAENPLGDFFITDLDDETILDPTPSATPQITVPPKPVRAAEESEASTQKSGEAEAPSAANVPAAEAAPATATPIPATEVPAPVIPAAETPTAEVVAETPAAEPSAPESPAVASVPEPAARSTRELQLAAALDRLMLESPQVEASALVSLDGFTMAAALPQGMHEDRVGAMSAAILGLGERAAAELGKGRLSQVFIEGDEGYVVLMAAGTGAVLTCLADKQAKLGLLLYDMRAASASIAELLG